MRRTISVQFGVLEMKDIERLAETLKRAAKKERDKFWAGELLRFARTCEKRVDPGRKIPKSRPPRRREIDYDAVYDVMEGEGELPLLTLEEARIASRIMTKDGRSAKEIARRTRVADRTVQRWRKNDRESE